MHFCVHAVPPSLRRRWRRAQQNRCTIETHLRVPPLVALCSVMSSPVALGSVTVKLPPEVSQNTTVGDSSSNVVSAVMAVEENTACASALRMRRNWKSPATAAKCRIMFLIAPLWWRAREFPTAAATFVNNWPPKATKCLHPGVLSFQKRVKLLLWHQPRVRSRGSNNEISFFVGMRPDSRRCKTCWGSFTADVCERCLMFQI